LKSVKIIREHNSNKSKGFGFIEFDTKEGLEGALQADKSMLIGRALEVSVWIKKEDTGNRNSNYRGNKYNNDRSKNRNNNRNNNKSWSNNNRREENNKTRGGWTTRGGKRNNQRTGFSLTSKPNNPNQPKEEKEKTKSSATSFNPYDLLLGDEDTNINNDD